MKAQRSFLPKNAVIRKKSTHKTSIGATYDTPTFKAIERGMTGEKDILVVVSNQGESGASYRKMDDQLVLQLEILSHLSKVPSEGKEINAIRDKVGCPPYTFSYVQTFYPGSEMGLVTGWEEHGIDTLAGQTIMPNIDDDSIDRRQAVLYGVGNMQHLESVETLFLEYFNPICYAGCFADDILPSQAEDGLAKYFIMWELLADEAEAALKPALGEKGFGSLMNILAQKNANYGDKERLGLEQIEPQEAADWNVFGND